MQGLRILGFELSGFKGNIILKSYRYTEIKSFSVTRFGDFRVFRVSAF